MKHSPLSPRFVALLCALPLLIEYPVPALALEPQLRKHESPFSVVNSSYGKSVAMSDQHLLVGHPSPPNGSFRGNRVDVILRRTGRIVRTLLPPAGLEDSGFGYSVAISGQTAVVGAWQAEATGQAFVYDLRTGRRLLTLAPAGASGAFSFGTSVAIDGDLIVVGAPAGHHVPAVELGFTYVFSAKTGEQLFRLQALDAAAQQWFGASVAVAGQIIAIGAYGDTADRGAAYLFDARTGTQMRRIIAGDGQAGDRFGSCVDLSGGRLLVGAPLGSAPAVADCGTAYLFDVATGNLQREIFATNAVPNGGFGTAVALDGNLAWIGAPYVDGAFASIGRGHLFDARTAQELLEWVSPDAQALAEVGHAVAMSGSGLAIQAAGNGVNPAVYEWSNVARVLPMRTVARKGDFAPGAPAASFALFDHAGINNDGKVVIGARLAGAGAAGGKNVGVWNNLTGSLLLSRRTKDQDATRVPPGTISRIMGAPLMLNGTAVMLDAMLTGPGLNSSNNRSLYLNDAFGLTARYSTGVPVAALNGACISKWTDVVQAISGQGLHAMVVSLKQGVANVTADTDSGLLVADKTNTFDQEVEGKSAADGAMLGQFTGRIAQSTFAVTFTSFLQTEPSSNMALLKLIPGLNPTKLMRRSDEIVETPGLKPVVNTLLGETVAEDTDVLWRASLRTGSQEVTTANNEGLWSDRFDAQKLVVRKGDPLPGALGATLTFDRFLKFWAINNNRVMFLAKLKGRGVNASNDCALFVSQGDESMMLLVREGDAAPEGGGATIGVIQRIEVDTVQGRYAVLCSLAKCASSSNQALYLGRINSGNTTTQSASRLPFLGLRKGSLYQGSLGSTTTLRSMSLPATSNDATGAGSKGYSRAINASGELVLPILFNNNALQIMRGSP